MNVARIIAEAVWAASNVPFEWNLKDDCIGWAAGIAKTMTNRDVVAHLRGTYSNEAEAKRAMVRLGFANLGDVAASLFKEISPARASTGDWVIISNQDDGMELIGVVSYDRVLAKAKTGIATVPRTEIKRAFRVE